MVYVCAMILIFGGTTEGRMAIEVCEQTGRTYYYSTYGSQQQVELVHGLRLIGPMTASDIVDFCEQHEVKCIVDASHPFAEGLHQSIAEAAGQLRDVTLVRLERPRQPGREGVTYCRSFQEAVELLLTRQPRLLLALSGVNTIARLRPYWQHHKTIFRILNRPQSTALALQQGFPANQMIYFDDLAALPTQQQEQDLMLSLGCDAIITKDSGEQGGFAAKVDAALHLGLQVYVVERPDYPDATTVTGRHSLRRELEQAVPGFFPLRTGLTTGTCATAAVKAAAMLLLGKSVSMCNCQSSMVNGQWSIETVEVELPDGESVVVPVESAKAGEATVIKDFSDDPDVTRGCRITARVQVATDRKDGIRFLQGKGVGRVTLPGLGITVGEPAINPVPRRMMEIELRQLTSQPLDVTISVEGGEELAERTFNSRVGVVGGISIIGTSGIVSPLSNEAFIESIGRELQVARAMGCTSVGLASGKRGEEALLEQEPELRVIHYGNFIGAALEKAHALGFNRVVIGIMLGKAVKLAEGHMDTHSHKVLMNKEFLIEVARSMGVADAESLMDGITMARELWNIMPPAFFTAIRDLCYRHCRTVFPSGQLDIHLIRSE